MQEPKTQSQLDIISWIENDCDFAAGCDLYNKYGSNTILKRTVFVTGRNFPSIAAKLKMELCNVAGIPFDPLNPNDIKKKFQHQDLPKASESSLPTETKKANPAKNKATKTPTGQRRTNQKSPRKPVKHKKN